MNKALLDDSVLRELGGCRHDIGGRVAIIFELILADNDSASLNGVRYVVSILILHVMIEVAFKFLEGVIIFVDFFSEGRGKTSFFCFLLYHLQQVINHLVLISQLGRNLVICHCL